MKHKKISINHQKKFEAIAESRHLEPGDVVIMTGIIKLEQGPRPRKFLIRDRQWGSIKSEMTMTATYMGQTRTTLNGVPYEVRPEGFRSGMGQVRESRTLIVVQSFMTESGDIVFADLGMCERID